jgi:hypothetical protein
MVLLLLLSASVADFLILNIDTEPYLTLHDSALGAISAGASNQRKQNLCAKTRYSHEQK